MCQLLYRTRPIAIKILRASDTTIPKVVLRASKGSLREAVASDRDGFRYLTFDEPSDR